MKFYNFSPSHTLSLSLSLSPTLFPTENRSTSGENISP